jgi:biopolymer transport protein ExbD
MAISVNLSASGGKKSLDAELNLVPFIDLLVCCICFLLLTAVWVQLSAIPTSSRPPRSPGAQTEHRADPPLVLVGSEGYTVLQGENRLVIPRQGSLYDDARLVRELRSLRARTPGSEGESTNLTVAAEDGISMRHVIRAMDLARGTGFLALRVTDSTAAM